MAGASGGGSTPPAADGAASGEAPAWARRLENAQAISHGVSTAAHSLRSGDHGGGSAAIALSEDRS